MGRGLPIFQIYVFFNQKCICQPYLIHTHLLVNNLDLYFFLWIFSSRIFVFDNCIFGNPGGVTGFKRAAVVVGQGVVQ